MLKRIGVRYVRIPDCVDCIHFMKHDYKCRLFSKNIFGKVENELAENCRNYDKCTHSGIYYQKEWFYKK